MRGVREVSAGGIVFKSLNSDIKICLIARRNKKKLVWCLPKGHVEPDETLEATALREVKEETGLSGILLGPLGSITYQFFDPSSKKRIFKVVHFFLIRYQSGKTTDHDDEVESVQWFPIDETLKIIEYKGEFDILKKAKAKLLNEQN